MDRTCIIVNPVAGSAADLAGIVGLLGRIPGARVMLTTAGGDAEMIAREALEYGFRRFVAAGGDGTINGVLNGIAPGLPEVEMGIVPLGTGNDLAASLGMRGATSEVIPRLEAWRVRPVDLVRIRSAGRDRLMINGSAGGFVQEVGAATDQDTKRGFLGPLAYMLTAVISATEMTPYRLKVTLDGTEQSLEAIATIVSNGRTLGGGVPVNPEGLMDDGRVEVMVIPRMPLADLALLGMSVMNGTHRENRAVLLGQARSVRITGDPPMPFNADGESIGSTPVEYEVLPGALRMVVGQEPALEAELSDPAARNAR
jgi:diacylglycerol kinase (ATP)